LNPKPWDNYNKKANNQKFTDVLDISQGLSLLLSKGSLGSSKNCFLLLEGSLGLYN
jgi:hypothetical protein